MARPIEEVFHDHLAKRAAGDVEGDIAENYSPGVILLTGTGSFKGHDGVRASAKELASYVGEIPFEYNHTMIEGQYAFLEWTADGKDRGVYDGADSFVVEDGKIIMQTIHYSVARKP